MKKYAKIINEETKACEVGLGTNTAFYKSIGMSEMEVEQAYDGSWYLKGYAPEKPTEQKEAEVRAVRDNYMQTTQNRIDRYRNQKELGIETTDTEEVFKQLLEYTQYLRDYPSGENWWVKNPMVFNEWVVSTSELSV